jgi:quinol monooxygenase YgiN
MIRLRGQLRCLTAEDAATVFRLRAEHVRLTRAEPGCVDFDIAPTDDPMVWEVMEAFRTRADFDAHQSRTRGSVWFAGTRGCIRDFVVEEIGD